ncbi:thioredoxin domain-containing protein [Aegicerativicinus sediminis]|uniref:thioredoxin domain-containing protein n=1 Tax=Aegicerativicinus sediminis TaxID=2893202 RepID=UPI001E3A72B5|nr:thioredoxin domain-containing protein [Aegicerativicinus sediminis]
MRAFLLKITLSLCMVLTYMGCRENKSESMNEEKQANDLINEQSPYLLQHAYNPVDWKPWSNEALEEAKKANKLVVVSIGYASCHWCHVMEEESFENDSVAAIMNEHFINIKVDREERPDVDQIYMDAAQLMTGRGGWPLNCITLPDGRPVYAGTYHTKDQWIQVLDQLQSLYVKSPDKMEQYASRLMGGLEKMNLVTIPEDKTSFTSETVFDAVEHMKSKFDMRNGGDRNVQKFPMPSKLVFLMRYGFQTEDKNILSYVDLTLDKMAFGGIYDQIGGGFARYAVDSLWHVPHFEKMLYDNAQLVTLYSKAYRRNQKSLYKSVIVETLNFVESELTNGVEGFYSSLDADSNTESGELEEGAYYVWSENELKSILGNDFNLFQAYYNVNKNGLWEHNKYVLRRTEADSVFVKNNSLEQQEFEELKSSWKRILLAQREKKSKPRLDDKILTSWSALMVSGYVNAYKALSDENYKKVAVTHGNFLKSKIRMEDGGLYHMYKDGKASVTGYLEDYAATIQAFLGIYEITFDPEWLKVAEQLTNYTIEHFQDKEHGLFYFTSINNDPLISRKLELYDNVIPASNSIMSKNLFLLSHYLDKPNYLDLSGAMIDAILTDLKNAPSGFFNWMDVMMDQLGPFYEVAINGKKADQYASEYYRYYIPNNLTVGAENESELPLLENRYQKEKTLVYVCVNKTCKLPVDSIEKAIPLIETEFK